MFSEEFPVTFEKENIDFGNNLPLTCFGSPEDSGILSKRTEEGGMKATGLVGNNNNTLTTNNNNVTKAEDEEEMFGRSYGTSFCRPNRPTMISAKYRQKEERRKVLKISINKLKKIEDPESSLRRSVLINNTMKRLQREAREEKAHKQQAGGFRCFASDFLKEEPTVGAGESLADITNLREESGGGTKRKRPLDEVDDSDVHAVLSQFYMPLTPRMLTSIDEDEDEINVVDLEVGGGEVGKRPRLEEEPPRPTPPPLSCGHSSMFTELQSVVYHSLIASLET